ncbi:hypothetical protein M8J75_015552 [Diaphorina citri]|nr:hypothetical protein M8J75_015552 [Diaphorina citri]
MAIVKKIDAGIDLEEANYPDETAIRGGLGAAYRTAKRGTPKSGFDRNLPSRMKHLNINHAACWARDDGDGVIIYRPTVRTISFDYFIWPGYGCLCLVTLVVPPRGTRTRFSC